MSSLPVSPSLAVVLSERAQQENLSVDELIQRLLDGRSAADHKCNQLQAICAIIPESVATLTTDLTFQFVNSNLASNVGMAVPDILGRTPTQLGFPPSLTIASREAIQTQKTQTVAFAFSETDDACFYEAQIAPTLDADHTVESLAWFIRDITEHKRVVEALRESEQRFRNMANVAPVMIWMSGRDKLCNFFNDKWLEFTGRTHEQEYGYGWAEGVHPDDLERCKVICETSFDVHQNFSMEYRLRDAHGIYRWILDNGVPRYTPDGTFEGYIGACIDIDKMKQAEAQLNQFKQAVEQSPASIVITNPQGDITYVNPRFAEVTGYKHEEAIGKNPRILKSGHTSMDDYARMWKTITGGGVWRGEFHNRKKDGTTYWERASISGVKNEHGAITNYVAVKDEITEQKQILDALYFVAQTAWKLIDSEFYRAVCNFLAKTLHVDEVCISQLIEPDLTRARTIARLSYGQFTDPIEYDLAGTPCESVAGKTSCCYTRDVQKLFPDDRFLADLNFESYAGTPLWGWDGRPLGMLVLFSSKPIDNAATTVTILQFFAMRIAHEMERVRAEKVMRDSEQFANSTLDSLAANIAIVDAGGKIIAVNQNWRDFAAENGGSSATGEGANYLDVCRAATGDNAAEASRFANGLLAVLRGEHNYFETEYPCHSPNQQRWFVVRVTPLLVSDSRKAVITHMDITSRKRIENALAASEQRYRLISESISDYAFSYHITPDREVVLEWITESFNRATGYTLAEVRTLGPLCVFHPEDQERAAQDIERVKNGEEAIGEYRVVTKKGEVSWMRVSRLPIWDDAHQQVIRYYGVTQNITAQKAAESAIVEQMRLQSILEQEQVWHAAADRLMKVISHEMRNPLTVIATSASILDRYFDQVSEGTRREKLTTINRQVRRMNQTIDDLILLIRGSLDRAAFQPEPMDIAQFCETMVGDMRETVGLKHQITFHCEDDSLPVLADERLISRILINLLSNAIKYSPDGSEVRLDLRYDHDLIVLSVSDQGIGISEEEQAQIFEPFYRASNALQIGGTGLGLNIVKDCVELHGGTISLRSSPGEGSTFAINLPYIKPPA